MATTYGYARVSTKEQELAVQMEALKAAGCEFIFADKLTGTTMDRPQFKRLMRTIRPADAVIVYKLDRLGRTLKSILDTVEEFERRDVMFRSLKETIDTTTALGKAFYHLIGVFAQLE